MSSNDRPPLGSMKKKVGFALLSPERRKEVARKGGAAVPAHRRSYAQNKALAAAAGKIGGRISRGGGRKRQTEEE